MGLRKWSYDKVNDYVKSVGYKLVSKNYLNTKGKITIQDDDGYYYVTSFEKILSGQHPNRFHVSNAHTIENIKLWCKLHDKNFLLISGEYNGNKANNLIFKCLKCNEEFSKSLQCLLLDTGCPYCSNQKVNLENCLANNNIKVASEWNSINNGSLTPYDVTSGSEKRVWWKCEKQHEWVARIADRNKGKNCPYCSGKLPTKDNNLLDDNPALCKEWNYNKNRKRPEEFTPKSNKIVWWKCKMCSHEWQSSIVNRNGQGKGCPECNQSKGESIISNYLQNNNLLYIPQKEYGGLTGLGNGNLSYDFLLPKFNLLIEYQGEQHEKYTTLLHKTITDFERQQEHDRRKKKYALDNKINFLEIWYKDFENIQDILHKELNLLSNGANEAS